MSHNAKNYFTQGGDELVIGGKLTVLEGADVTGLAAGDGEHYSLPTATGSVLGGIKADAKGSGDTVPCKIGSDGKLYVPKYPVAAKVADATDEEASTLQTTLNGLLAALRTAGILAK